MNEIEFIGRLGFSSMEFAGAFKKAEGRWNSNDQAPPSME
jgi:hypothetical protein